MLIAHTVAIFLGCSICKFEGVGAWNFGAPLQCISILRTPGLKALNGISMESAQGLFLNYGTTLKCHFYDLIGFT